MARLSIDPEYVTALVEAGFRAHVVRGLIEFEVYRREASGRWFLQAQIGDDGHLEVGLTLDGGWGSFIGPIHRARSARALARALPEIVGSLGALAVAEHRLRCPRCGAWTVARAGQGGPVLACSRRGKVARPAGGTPRDGAPCGGALRLPALHVHGEPAGGGAQAGSRNPDAPVATAVRQEPVPVGHDPLDEPALARAGAGRRNFTAVGPPPRRGR